MPPTDADGTADVVVVGGGVIGLSSAWALARRGASVVVVDPSPTRGASWAAAGMLAPVTEVHVGDEALLRLTLPSAARWPAFAAAVEEASGLPSGYRAQGTLVVALDADDRAELARLAAFQASLGLVAQPLTSREARTLEPGLAPDVRAGLLVDGDHSVHNRLLLAALLEAAGRAGVDVRLREAARLHLDGPRVGPVELDDGTRLTAGSVVLAAGAWTPLLAGLPPEVVPPVRPVTGQILRLRGTPRTGTVLRRTLRAVARGHGVYLVPRDDGEVAVGATTEERGYDAEVTAGGVWELLRDARAVLPGVAECEFVEHWAGLRPVTPDNAPVVGPAGPDGLVLACGHGRNGVLLAPLTADAVAGLVLDGAAPEVAGFGLDRFGAPGPAGGAAPAAAVPGRTGPGRTEEDGWA